MYVTLDIANICDDESEKEKLELFLQPKMSGIKIEICSTVNSIRKLIYIVCMDFQGEKNWNKTPTRLSL